MYGRVRDSPGRSDSRKLAIQTLPGAFCTAGGPLARPGGTRALNWTRSQARVERLARPPRKGHRIRQRDHQEPQNQNLGVPPASPVHEVRSGRRTSDRSSAPVQHFDQPDDVNPTPTPSR